MLNFIWTKAIHKIMTINPDKFHIVTQAIKKARTNELSNGDCFMIDLNENDTVYIIKRKNYTIIDIFQPEKIKNYTANPFEQQRYILKNSFCDLSFDLDILIQEYREYLNDKINDIIEDLKLDFIDNVTAKEYAQEHFTPFVNELDNNLWFEFRDTDIYSEFTKYVIPIYLNQKENLINLEIDKHDKDFIDHFKEYFKDLDIYFTPTNLYYVPKPIIYLHINQ
jgi:hypothetical protein